MTTFISSSARRRALLLVTALSLTAGCGKAEDATKAPADANATSAPAAPVASTAPSTPDAATAYTADLRRALAGERKGAFTVDDAFGGMACTPRALGGVSAATRRLTLTLPEREADRAHVLAVVTPERGVLEVYAPYHGETEDGDLIVPSQAISWAKAREQRSFATSTDALDGLRPNSDTPKALFIEPGRYRFVLANGIDAELLKANGTAPRALAGCSFDWQP